jgi:hypothetical protein
MEQILQALVGCQVNTSLKIAGAKVSLSGILARNGDIFTLTPETSPAISLSFKSTDAKYIQATLSWVTIDVAAEF